MKRACFPCLLFGMAIGLVIGFAWALALLEPRAAELYQGRRQAENRLWVSQQQAKYWAAEYQVLSRKCPARQK